MDMEVVKKFNAALSSLYVVKLPISKAKMSEITRISMNGAKMYKHIVQSVERFIHKCRPEYKLPALYVIDSIVRQSRHQFTPEKDVYGPRFTRNLFNTFQNLFLTCLPEDKPKIVRVLNLWQKNSVFSPGVIQPLLDLANPKAHLEQVRFQQARTSPKPERDSINIEKSANSSAKDAANAVISLANNLNKKDNATLISQLQQLANSLNLLKNEEEKSSFHFSNLEYGVDNFDDDNRSSTPTEAEPPYTKPQNSNPKEIDSIASLVSKIFNNTDFIQQINNGNPNSRDIINNVAQLSQLDSSLQQFISNESVAVTDQVDDNTSHLLGQNDSTLPPPLFAFNSTENNFYDHNAVNNFNQIPNEQVSEGQLESHVQPSFNDDPVVSQQLSEQPTQSQQSNDYYSSSGNSRSRRSRSKSTSVERRSSRYSSRYARDRSPSRSRSPDSYNRDNDNRNHRSRYRSRSRSSSPYSLERARKRDRRRKGYPSSRKNCVTICSTTLWIGHIPKFASESDLSDVFGEYGVINSIDMIPSRGCAFVCMDRRQDAFKAFNKLKSNPKVFGSQVKFAWAPGKGMKDKEYKDYWESDIGCSFIPTWVLNEQIDLDVLEEGGVFDEDTMPDYLKESRKLKQLAKKQENHTTTLPTPMIQLPFVPVPATNNTLNSTPSIPIPMASTNAPGPSPLLHQFPPFNPPPPPPPGHLLPVPTSSAMPRFPISIPPSGMLNPPPWPIPPVTPHEVNQSLNSSNDSVQMEQCDNDQSDKDNSNQIPHLEMNVSEQFGLKVPPVHLPNNMPLNPPVIPPPNLPMFPPNDHLNGLRLASPNFDRNHHNDGNSNFNDTSDRINNNFDRNASHKHSMNNNSKSGLMPHPHHPKPFFEEAFMPPPPFNMDMPNHVPTSPINQQPPPPIMDNGMNVNPPMMMHFPMQPNRMPAMQCPSRFNRPALLQNPNSYMPPNGRMMNAHQMHHGPQQGPRFWLHNSNGGSNNSNNRRNNNNVNGNNFRNRGKGNFQRASRWQQGGEGKNKFNNHNEKNRNNNRQQTRQNDNNYFNDYNRNNIDEVNDDNSINDDTNCANVACDEDRQNYSNEQFVHNPVESNESYGAAECTESNNECETQSNSNNMCEPVDS